MCIIVPIATLQPAQANQADKAKPSKIRAAIMINAAFSCSIVASGIRRGIPSVLGENRREC